MRYTNSSLVQIIGQSTMSYHRLAMNESGVIRADHLKGISDGTFVRIAGAVIARQRPRTASGFIFISLVDETGISNAIIHPKVYEENKLTVTRGRFLMVEGSLQNQDGVVSVKASVVRVLELGSIDMRSHDFIEICRAGKPAEILSRFTSYFFLFRG